MFRFLGYVLLVLLALTVIRNVARWITSALSQATKSTPVPTPKAGPLSGELKKDPVCGTYTAGSIQATIRGETFYFCSPQCRDKYVALAS